MLTNPYGLFNYFFFNSSNILCKVCAQHRCCDSTSITLTFYNLSSIGRLDGGSTPVSSYTATLDILVKSVCWWIVNVLFACFSRRKMYLNITQIRRLLGERYSTIMYMCRLLKTHSSFSEIDESSFMLSLLSYVSLLWVTA